MPKELTHWLLAERALNGLAPEGRLARTIREHHQTFLAGAVLPDTLPHVFKGPYAGLAPSLASRFHNPAGNSYEPLLRAEGQLSGEIGPQLFSCLLGVLCHMQADIVFHPFVYAAAGVTDIARHYMIETAIDCHVARNGGQLPARTMKELVSSTNMGVLVQTCAILFDPDRTLPEQALAEAIRLHCRFQSLYSRASWHLLAKALALLGVARLKEQQHLFYPLPFSTPLDLSQYERGWRHPASGERIASTIAQLADKAVGRIIELFKRLENTERMADVLRDPPGENLLSGTYGVTHEEMTSRRQ